MAMQDRDYFQEDQRRRAGAGKAPHHRTSAANSPPQRSRVGPNEPNWVFYKPQRLIKRSDPWFDAPIKAAAFWMALIVVGTVFVDFMLRGVPWTWRGLKWWLSLLTGP